MVLRPSPSRPSKLAVVAALFWTAAIPAAGFVSFGPVPALLFLVGYLGGFLLWMTIPTRASFSEIKWYYWGTFVLFAAHRVEEKLAGFFPVLAEMTGVLVPQIASSPIILLLALSVGSWLIGPLLHARGSDFGHYLIWTFFASMGFTELAHFLFPLFRQGTYRYFPGMLTVIALAPVAWFSMMRLARCRFVGLHAQ